MRNANKNVYLNAFVVIGISSSAIVSIERNPTTSNSDNNRHYQTVNTANNREKNVPIVII